MLTVKDMIEILESQNETDIVMVRDPFSSLRSNLKTKPKQENADIGDLNIKCSVLVFDEEEYES